MTWKQRAENAAGYLIFLAIGSYFQAIAAQSNQEDVVFRLGTFDRSSAEFAQGKPGQPVNFIVNTSDPSRDWFATQPAEFESAAGTPIANSAAAPRTITFSVGHAPAAAYQLHVSVLIENPSVPALQISINGKHGMFYLHPKLDYNMGDMISAYYPAYSSADVLFTFPGALLHQGTNTIDLQVIEEADKGVPDAGLTYDAIELDSVPGHNRDDSSAQIRPTIFYQEMQDHLEEIVDVFIPYFGHVSTGHADLMIAGKHYHQSLRGNQDFGEEKCSFSVLEFPAHTRVELTWDTDGHPYHREESIDPQKKWTLFLVPHIHLDVGYTDYQAKVAAIQSRVIDEAMDLTAQHPDFRFSIDGSGPIHEDAERC